MASSSPTMTDAPSLIQAVEQADSPDRLIQAVRALADARLEAGISALIAVLGYNNPTAAVAAVGGLIQLGEAAVQPLIEQLDEYNYGARAYAMRALATIADPRALDLLIAAAETDFAPSVRRAAAKGLGNLRWGDAADRQSARVLQTLLSIAGDADWSIRYAAVVGLQGLSSNCRSQIQAALEQMAQSESDVAVRARIALAQRSIGG